MSFFRHRERDASRLRQAGMSLLEVTIGLTLSVVIMGTLVTTQQAASDAFTSSMSEQRTTGHARRGMGAMRKQMRRANHDTLEVANLPEGVVLRFQESIAFQVATGTTTWGAEDDEDARIEWYVEGDRLYRRVIDFDDEPKPGTDVLLVPHLDTREANPVELIWDEVAKNMQIKVRVREGGHASAQSRLIETTTHIEPLFLF